MPISRMQQPRQMYGLGSFVKKAVKGVTGAVKSAAGGIKDILKSDAGKLALLAGGLYLGGGTGGISSLFGKAKTFMGGLPGAEAIGGYLKTKGGKTLLAAGAGTLLGGLGQKVEEGDTEAIAATRDVGALRSYLFSGYKNLGYTDDQAQELTNKDVAEYTSGQGGYATGGRVGYAMGTDEEEFLKKIKEEDDKVNEDEDYLRKIIDPEDMASADEPFYRSEYADEQSFRMFGKPYKDLSPSELEEFSEEMERLRNKFFASGGRVQYAMGTPEDKAKQASGIMGIPLNKNAAGVTELDLRNNGGFIPPVGIKEKADDIPAMLSNNEFVFTADAVRGMGDGNVNKGAQRMYDMMKALEKRVV